MIAAQCKGFINTPPIWEGKQFDVQQFEFPTVDMSSFQPKAIEGNFRLGHQIEFACKQLIAASNTYDIVLHNLQVSNDARTIGEIDFILRNKLLGTLVHVELTYKFYLIDTAIQDPIHSLIGPNRRDLFYTKLGKIKSAQFSLLHTIEGMQALSERDIDHTKVEHQCCFKAQLFQPYGDASIDLGNLNKGCLAGYWLKFEEFNSANFKEAQYYVPSKSEWVIEPHTNVPWKSHSDIKETINRSLIQERAPFLWMKKNNSEYEKIFIVWW